MNILRFVAKSLIHGAVELTGRPRRQRQRLRGGLIVLTYHSFCKDWPRGLFNSLPVHQFEQQLRFLKQHFEVVSLERGISNIKSGTAAEKPFVALTIDDGFQDNYNLAWPLLKRYDVPATIFLATDFLDTGRPPWPTQLQEILERTNRQEMSFPFFSKLLTRTQKSFVGQRLKQLWSGLPPAERFSQLSEFRAHLGVANDTKHPALEWNHVREMHKHGMSFGSHTAYHSILPDVNNEVVEQELKESKQRVEAELNTPCNFFAYPDGKHDDRTCQLVKSAGFVASVTQDRGCNISKTNPLQLRRIEVPFHDPISTFRGRVGLAW